MADQDPSERARRAASLAKHLDLTSSDFVECEFAVYDLLRREVPIQRTESEPSCPGGAWFVSRYRNVSEVVRDPARYSSQQQDYPVRPWIPQAVDPPAHTAYRRILNPWFAPERLEALDDHIEAFADERLDRMLGRDEFDFFTEFADPFPAIIFCELMGFPLEDHPRIMRWKNTLMHGMTSHPESRALVLEKARTLGLVASDFEGELTGEAHQKVRQAVGGELYAYFDSLLAQRREAPRADVISELLSARYEGERPLSHEEIQDTLLLLFMAGLDTVASTLGLIVHHFAMHPADRRAFVSVIEDPERLAPAIEELVRFHAIVTLPRRVTQDTKLGDVRLSAEDHVLVSPPSANRDPEEFPCPEQLQLDRHPNRHLGFGLGPHRCLGIHLARRELRIGLRALHRRLPDYRLHPQRTPEIFGGIMKGMSSLWLIKG